MPLRAINANGASLHAFDYDKSRWAQLKIEYRYQGLSMPCCDAGAIPKTSSRGTQFFAHARRPYCNRCLHCGAPQNNHHVGEKIRKAYLDSDKQSGLDLVPINRIVKGTGRWVFEAMP